MAISKTIISCAITGSIHTPFMSPHLPVTQEEIAQSALEAAEAGAAIVHLHVRDPQTGKPVHEPADFEPFLRDIKQRSGVVVNITTGASPYMPVDYHVKPAKTWQPEVASLNMGSMNLGLFPMLKRFKSFKHDLWIGKGELARSNTDRVKKVRKIIEGLGGKVASPDEARTILGLKGGDKVAF